MGNEFGMLVVADESVRSPADAARVAGGQLAHGINLKLAKLGVDGALQAAAVARRAGLALMVGGMVETRLAMGFAAQLVSALGGVEFVDLDTPLLLAEETVLGGYVVDGPRYFLGDKAGNAGAALAWSRDPEGGGRPFDQTGSRRPDGRLDKVAR